VFADFGEGAFVGDVGDGAVGAFFTEDAGGFAPAGWLDAKLLAVQGNEDLELLFAEAV
jgi:hypothetical protein